MQKAKCSFKDVLNGRAVKCLSTIGHRGPHRLATADVDYTAPTERRRTAIAPAPSRHAGPFLVQWRRWNYTEHGERRGIDPDDDRHVMKTFGGAPCFNRDVVAWWKAAGRREIVALFRRDHFGSARWTVDIDTFVTHAHPSQQPGYEPQLWLAVEEWTKV